MQLSPLQSRLAASLIASCLVLVLYLFLFAPQLASATELGTFPIALEPDGLLDGFEGTAEPLETRGPSYEPEFSLFDRGIIGRAPAGVTSLSADRPERSNISPGGTITYVFETSSISGRSTQGSAALHELRRSLNEALEATECKADANLVRRQKASRTLYISANTCDQPNRISPDQTTMDPPQLTLFVSTSNDNTSPGPTAAQNSQKTIVFDEGAVMFKTSLDSDVYFSISAPQVSDKYFDAKRPYNYEVAVSLDTYYASYDSVAQPNLIYVDADASSAFLKSTITNGTKDDISTPPYMLFAQKAKSLDINGIRKSYCGLSNWAQIRPLHDGLSQASIGLRNVTDNSTVQEFYISGLDASTNYTGIVALNTRLGLQKRQENGSGGGMIVYEGIPFWTKPNGACTFIFNLTMCTETQYAVPGNPESFPNGTALAKFYDEYTNEMWGNFDKVLQQTPCEAPPTQRYSLARGCGDCKRAYKNWLCSVAIPRCEDFSSPNQTFLHMRNINAPFPNGSLVDAEIRSDYGMDKAYNSSRNLKIDEKVKPGPYKELLPCDDLCYELVRSCPASMGFACPTTRSKYGFLTSYAIRNQNGELSCNYPGSAHYRGAASSITVSWASMATLLLVTLLVVAR